MNNKVSANFYHKIFYLYIALQVLLWTLGPTFLRHTIPHDVAEGIAWGNQLQWGYDKMPPLTAWYISFFNKLNIYPGWAVYLGAQIVIMLTFCGVWRLALLFMSPSYALLSVLLLQGVIYYNNTSSNITPDTMSMFFWVWIPLYFYLAVTRKKLFDWYLLGILVGGGFLTKYSLPLLLLPLFICSLFSKQARKMYKTYGPYFSVFVMFVILLPHLLWLYNNDFISIKYVLYESTMHDFTKPSSPFLSHIIFPLNFLIEQLGAIVFLFILALPLYKGKKNSNSYTDFQKIFITCVTLGPFILTFLYAMITGNHVISRWGKPYFGFLGIYLLMVLSPQISWKTFKTTTISCFLFGFFIFSIRMLYIFTAPLIKPVRSDFSYPAKKISSHIDTLWNNHYKQKLDYIAGDHYLTAYVSIYSKNKPIPFMGCSITQSPWIKETQFRQKGAILSWKIKPTYQCVIPKYVTNKYPKAILLGCEAFKRKFYFNSNYNCHDINLGFAILPPE